MKTVLAFLLLLSAGCNQYRAELAVRNVFPNAQIKRGNPMPKYHFMVKDGTNIYYAVCYGTSRPETYTKDFLFVKNVNDLFE